MKKKIPKLALTREFIRTLGTRGLTHVVGGGGETDVNAECSSMTTKIMAERPNK